MKKNDYILFLVILLSALFLHFYLNTPKAGEKIVIIKHDNTVVARLPLKNTNKEIPITTMHGTVVVKIEKNSVSIIKSPCPHKLCINQGKITKQGQTIACLPEKVVLQIISTTENDSYINREENIDAIVK